MQSWNERVRRAAQNTFGSIGRWVLLTLIFSGVGHAQEREPVIIDGPAGQAVYIDQGHKDGNDAYGFAGAFRAGNFLFVSGVVAGSRDGAVLDADGLKDAIRRALRFAGETLAAAGSDLDHVVDIVTFHVWDSEYFDGDKDSQLQAIVDVKREFMRGPDPAWTAVGTTELVPDRGIIEIRLTAYAPSGTP